MTALRAAAVALAALTIGTAAEPPLREQAAAAMKRATAYFHGTAASHGGYVYHYSADLSRRWGEGEATADQIWVQDPGTPAVGMAYLAAYAATGEKAHLEAARAAAEALVFGQLDSGGWQNCVDFAAEPKRPGQLRNGKQSGRNYSSLDDGITQHALRFLIHAAKALPQHAEIRDAVKVGLDAVLAAQFPSGGFPQVWNAPVAPHPAVKAALPDYDWRTENRIKEYWNLPTLNDGLATDMVRLLEDAAAIHGDARCKAAIAHFGDFLILAQMPTPQPGWAQQYHTNMIPAWARKFEPPAIAGRESEDVIEALLAISRITGDKKYLAPIPPALAWLKSSLLPDSQLARYYELRTNRPLYMTSDYELTYDDSDVPKHYGWKAKNHIASLEKNFSLAQAGRLKPRKPKVPAEDAVRAIIAALDTEGRWLSVHGGGSLFGQVKFPAGERYLSSEVFSKNMQLLAAFVAEKK